MQIFPFLFISGGEIVFTIFIILMVFGADKIPDMARELGKGLRTLKNATNDIKNEITKSAEKQGINTKSITQDVQEELNNVKDEVEDISGSIKRKL